MFNNAIQFSKEICDILGNDISIIMHVINTLMFSNEEPWAKKGRNKDLPIDCYNGAEICELIGTYLFDQINAISKKKKKKKWDCSETPD